MMRAGLLFEIRSHAYEPGNGWNTPFFQVVGIDNPFIQLPRIAIVILLFLVRKGTD